MKNVILSLLSLISLTIDAQNNFNYQRDFKPILAMTKADSALNYDKLLSRFKANDTSLSKYETLALLIGFTDQPDYKPFDDIDTEKDIFLLNDNSKYDEALEEANSYLATHPVSLRVLKEKSYSLHQLRKKDSANYYMDLVTRIMSAMLFSGNGKTPETAIFSLGLSDGERFAENIGMVVASKGTGETKTGLYMQIIDAANDEGVHSNLFFIIQHARNKISGIDKGDWGKKKTPKKGKNKKSKDQPDKE